MPSKKIKTWTEIELWQAFELKTEGNGIMQLRKNPVEIKLSKLTMIRFKGENLDWLRFWDQFETKIIDYAEITTVRKYSYLKKLVISKIRTLIDGLPFNTERCERAKTILKGKFGKLGDVSSVHIQCIVSLPAITQTLLEKSMTSRRNW